MRILSRKTLRDFWQAYKGASQPALEQELKTWYSEVDKATWATPAEVKAKYRSASVLKKGRVVFNICGNKFRLVVWINYPFRLVLIKWIGTHADYDKIDAEEV